MSATTRPLPVGRIISEAPCVANAKPRGSPAANRMLSNRPGDALHFNGAGYGAAVRPLIGNRPACQALRRANRPDWSHRVTIVRPDARFINSEETMFFRSCSIFVLSLLIPLSAAAESRCEQLLKAFGNQLADATCFVSADLTTNNPATTPANNTLPGVPIGAWTPVTDRSVIAPSAGKKTPITVAVPGVQIN